MSGTSRASIRQSLERMNDAIVHRGPDDQGAVLLGEAGLAMRRLSIIDLARGHQPIANEDGSAWIVFNGEIYNHRELRRDLLARGHLFQHRQRHRGHPPPLRGARRARASTICAGCSPSPSGTPGAASSCWRATASARSPCSGASTAGASSSAPRSRRILAAGGPDGPRPELDLRSLDEYLTLRFIPSPRTLFQGIRKLPPAHLLVLDASHVEPPRSGTWRPRPRSRCGATGGCATRPSGAITRPRSIEEAGERIREAVESHMISDVPVGAYLSGGMDSSLVVAMMAEMRDEPIQTFAVGVDDQQFNELPYARMVAEHCGTRHHEEMVWPDMVELLPSMVHHLDEPSDPIAACMYHAASLASRHVKVVLTGDGGDEIFAGYDRYFGFRWVNLYAALPEGVRRYLLGPAVYAMHDSSAYKNITQKARWVHDLSFHEGGRRYAQATAFFRFGQEGKGGLYAPDVAARLAEIDPMESVIRGFDEAEARNDLDRMLQADISTRLPEHSLMLSDRMTMARSLEARSPFLDHRLAEFVATLPASFKMRGKTLKYLLRRVAAPYLPETILKRPKQGFMFPLGYWMKGPLLPVLRHLLATSTLIEEGIFRREPIERLVAEHVANRADHHVRLWMILNVEIWYRMYVRGESMEDLSGLLRERLGSKASAA